MSVTSRFLPHPILTLVIAAVWIGLANQLSLGQAILGLVVGWSIPLFTSAYWPDRTIIKRPRIVLEYVAVVLWDILVSNVQVAYLVLFRRADSLRSQFVTVPLELNTPEAITVLAGTITMTPGTVSADLAADGSAILVHCLDTADAQDTARQIKVRYERRLKEIFE
jgi:multicomponent K+:H+ antiporter subunit E